jgi:hypothetical protein
MRSQESCTRENPHQEQISAEIGPSINRAFETKIAPIKARRDSFGPRCRADLTRLWSVYAHTITLGGGAMARAANGAEKRQA